MTQLPELKEGVVARKVCRSPTFQLAHVSTLLHHPRRVYLAEDHPMVALEELHKHLPFEAEVFLSQVQVAYPTKPGEVEEEILGLLLD